MPPTRHPLAVLREYERRSHHGHQASVGLLSTLVHGNSGSAWKRFLSEDDNLEAVVSQAVAISENDGLSPESALAPIREIVERTYTNTRRAVHPFPGAYLKIRPLVPAVVRDKLDQVAKAGKKTIPLRAAAMTSELERLALVGADDGAKEVFDHWYEEIIRGRVTTSEARKIPARVRNARDRLLGQLRESRTESVDESTVYREYSRLLKSKDVRAITDVTIASLRFYPGLGFEQIEPFLQNFPQDEAMARLEKLGDWMLKVNRWPMHDGVTLTPKLIEFLSQKADFDALLEELDRYREETRNGRFRIDNELQRELEFCRFVTAATSRFIHPGTWPPYELFDRPASPNDLPRLFNELEELPPPREGEYSPSQKHLAEARRAGFEAAMFLEMLREFRAHTSRQIVVVGNQRYGRQWVVQPIESYLTGDFTVRYDRVNSGASMRLTVPGPFPRRFVEHINEHMPHIVVADGAKWPKSQAYGRRKADRLYDVMKFSRATRAYANWFVVFNDIRAGGDISRYQNETSLPLNHVPEIKKWYEFGIRRQELQEWVTPGPTYRVTTWAPILRDRVVLGDIDVARQDVELNGDRPIVVLANPNIYRKEGGGLPSYFRDTEPCYMDEPQDKVRERIVFGFGAHGFETKLEGPTTETFVAAIQGLIKKELRGLQKAGVSSRLA